MNTTVKLDPKLKTLMEQIRNLDKPIREAAWDGTVQIAEGMMDSVKDNMPVDTGRAKASWGKFTAEDLARGKKRISKAKTGKQVRFRTGEGVNSGNVQVASASDAIWVEDKNNLSVDQGTRVDYTQYLNEGHSKRAPAQFIDKAEKLAERLSEKLGKEIHKQIDAFLKAKPLEKIQVYRIRVKGKPQTFRI